MRTLVLAACLLVTSAFVGCSDRHKADLEFVERITGVKLPVGTEVLADHDNRETFLVLLLAIPRASSGQFLQDHRFAGQPSLEDLSVLHRFLPVQHQLPAIRQDWLGVAGRSEKNRWEFAYDPSRSCLWCVVRYPDRAGDAP